jgi:hypothetical protein
MEFFKLTTADKETRWINLARISRATLADDHGKPLLAVLFAEGASESKFTILGGNPKNDKAIADLTARLDALSGEE